jgi:hypothetical protein
MTETYYKVLNADGSCYHGGIGEWDLPNGKPGEWKSVEGDLIVCNNGIHLCRRADLVHWLGPAIFEVECTGKKRIEVTNKIVVSKARLVRKLETWNDCTARLFAADCAEHVLPIWEKRYAHDTRPRAAIEAARQFAYGGIDSAACSAAYDAADAAADAASGADAYTAACSAAYAAACSATYNAARAATYAALEDAEREWQTARLFNYLDGEIA